MFLLLRLQTIPAQTALSGANPISGRIAGLRGGAAGRAAGAPSSSTRRDPRKQSREALGESPFQEPSPQLSSARAKGQRGARRCWSTRTGIVRSQQGQRRAGGRRRPRRRASSTLSSRPLGTALTPTQDTKGDGGPRVSEIRISLCSCFTVQRKRRWQSSLCIQLLARHENGYTGQFQES